jgi:hypothetical protein
MESVMSGKTTARRKIISKIDGGDMDIVYKAQGLKSMCASALKFFPPEWTYYSERFISRPKSTISSLIRSEFFNLFRAPSNKSFSEGGIMKPRTLRLALYLAAFLSWQVQSRAQWVQTSGPEGGIVQCIAVSGANLFAGTYLGGVFVSTDNGTSWTVANNGLTNKNVYCLAVSGTNLFAGILSGGGVFLSTNNGTSWTAAGLTNSTIQAIVVSGTNLFAGTSKGVFLSTNNGTSWKAINTGLTNTTVHCLAVSGTNLFAGTGGGVFLSTNNGTAWTAVNTGLTDTTVMCLAASGKNLFAGTFGGGVFLSTNNGTTWTAVNTGLTTTTVLSLAVNGVHLFAGTNKGVFLSTDSGTTWTEASTGLTNQYIRSLAVSGANLFAGTEGGGVFLSTNNGASWTQVNNGLVSHIMRSFAKSGANLFAGTSGGGVFLSTNNGARWTPVNAGLTNMIVQSLAVSGANLFAGTYGGGVFLSTNNGASWTPINTGLTNRNINCLAVSGANLFAGTYGGGVFLSTNNGTTWTDASTGLTSPYIRSLAVSGTYLFTGTWDGGVFLSKNNGTSWTAANTGLTERNIPSLAVSGTNLFAGTWGGGVFLSTNNGTSWKAVNNGFTGDVAVEAIVVSGTDLFAGTYYGGVFLSTNNGTSWTAVDDGLSNTTVCAIIVSGTNVFAGTDGSGVWRRPLSEMITSPPNRPSLSSPADGSIGLSTNPTLAWNDAEGATTYRLQVSTSASFSTLICDDSTLTSASRQVPGLANLTKYFWRVNAKNSEGASPFSEVWSFTTTSADQAINPNGGFEDATPGVKTAYNEVTGWYFFAADPSRATFEIVREGEAKEGSRALRVEITSLGANAWDAQAINTPFPVEPGVEYSVSVWARTDKAGLVVNVTAGSPSYDHWGGVIKVAMTTEWKEITFKFTAPEGATEGRIPVHFSESANGPYLPAAVYVDELRVTPSVTGVRQNNQIPFQFGLGQNYPNPFNPTTTIEFQLPSSSFVVVKVFDVFGKEVATLVEQKITAGTRRVTWNASGMPSGVYFYRIRAGAYSETKKCVIIR